MTEEEKKEEIRKIDEELAQGRKLAGIKSNAWLKRGFDIVYPERQEYYTETVGQVVKSGFYGINCLDAALDVMECLDGGASMEDAIELFDSKELDGPIYLNAQNLILNFSKKGPEFEEAYNEKHNIKISDSRKEAIERIKAENKSFAGKQL